MVYFELVIVCVDSSNEPLRFSFIKCRILVVCNDLFKVELTNILLSSLLWSAGWFWKHWYNLNSSSFPTLLCSLLWSTCFSFVSYLNHSAFGPLVSSEFLLRFFGLISLSRGKSKKQVYSYD